MKPSIITTLWKRQWRPYTCVPSVFRFIVHHLTYTRYSEREAMDLLGTMRKEGTSFRNLIQAIRDEGLHVVKFRNATEQRIDKALRSANTLVVCADDLSWRVPHIVTLVGMHGERYRLVDPMWGMPTFRSKGHRRALPQPLMLSGRRWGSVRTGRHWFVANDCLVMRDVCDSSSTAGARRATSIGS